MSTVFFFVPAIFIARAGMALPHSAWISYGLMCLSVSLVQFAMIILGIQVRQFYDVRQIKKIFPLILSAQITGAIMGGGLIGFFTDWVGGTKNLIGLSGFSMVLVLALLFISIRTFRQTWEKPTLQQKNSKSLHQLIKRKYVVYILFYQILALVVNQLIDYALMEQAHARFENSADLAQFLGNFVALATILSLLFLIFAAAKMLTRFGIAFGLLVNPYTVIFTIAIAMVMVIMPDTDASVLFYTLIFSRLLAFILRTGTTYTSMKAVYQPLSSHDRNSVETVVEGIGGPLAYGIAGVCLILLKEFSFSYTLGFILLVSVLWLVTAILVHRHYAKALEKSIKRRTLDTDDISLQDEASLEAITGLLKSTKTTEVLFALEVLEKLEHPTLDEVSINMLAHSEARVRIKALNQIEHHKRTSALPKVCKCFEHDSNLSVKANALRVICALRSEYAEEYADYLNSENPELRLNVMVGFFRYGGIPGIIAAGKHFESITHSQDAQQRILAAQVLEAVSFSRFYHPLLSLLKDESIPVRIAALKATGKMAHPCLFAALIDNLDSVHTRSCATNALIKAGEGIVDIVDNALCEKAGYPITTVLQLVRVCSEIKGEQILLMLTAHVSHPRHIIRYEILKALYFCGYKISPEVELVLHENFLAEAAQGLKIMRMLEFFSDNEKYALLKTALLNEMNQGLKRLFLILSLFYPEKQFYIAEEQIRSRQKEQQGLALEFLDISLPKKLKLPIMALVDMNVPMKSRVKSLTKYFSRSLPDTRKPSQNAWLADILQDNWTGAWIKIAVLRVIEAQHVVELKSVVESAMAGEEILIKECAAHTLHALSPEQIKPEKGVNMLSMVEKILHLKSVDIFSQIPEDDLLAIASIVEEVEVPADETIIRQHEMGSCLYLIVDGGIRIHNETKTIAKLGVGEILGEMSLLDPAPRSASATTIRDSFLFRIEKEDFEVIMSNHYEIAQCIIWGLCRRLRQSNG
ncbi:cyclic nucleotide-binding domain-containing protein [Candidatus Venteria ishoeyi]|nr:cyclic nucleotide-binding domain-containing protein [Candidatus Venteria ishoeyi]